MSPLRPPKQDRSRKTLDRLVAAALQLFLEQGVHETSVAQVVKRAHSSVGSFYARFSGKDDFLRYLHERVWTDARERWDVAMESVDWARLDLPGVVASLVALYVDIHSPGLEERAALEGAATASEEHLGRAPRFHEHVISRFSAVLLEKRGEIGHPDPELAVPIGYHMLTGAVERILADGGSGAQATDTDRLVAELSSAYLAYLGGEPAPPAQAPPEEPRPPEPEAPKPSVDFFDVWG